jgi:hypothetical protein
LAYAKDMMIKTTPFAVFSLNWKTITQRRDGAKNNSLRVHISGIFDCAEIDQIRDKPLKTTVRWDLVNNRYDGLFEYFHAPLNTHAP